VAHKRHRSGTFAQRRGVARERSAAGTGTRPVSTSNSGGISGIGATAADWGIGISKCPVILHDANDGEATRNDAMDAGCIEYLRKSRSRVMS